MFKRGKFQSKNWKIMVHSRPIFGLTDIACVTYSLGTYKDHYILSFKGEYVRCINRSKCLGTGEGRN